MNFITFLFRISRWRVLASVLAGVLSAAANILLLALINSALNASGRTGASLIWRDRKSVV